MRAYSIAMACLLPVFIAVPSDAQIKLTSPNGGEQYASGDTIEFTWSGVSLPRPVILQLRTDGGETWTGVQDSARRGRFSWTVPDIPPSTLCLARVIEVIDSAVTLPQVSEYIVSWAEFSPDSRVVLKTEYDGLVQLWDVATGDTVRTISEKNRGRSRARFSPDGRSIVVVEQGQAVVLYDTFTGEQRWSAQVEDENEIQVEFSPDGAWLAVYYDDNGGRFEQPVQLINTASGEIVHNLVTDNTQVRFVAFSPDSRQIVTPAQNAELRFWSVETGERLMTVKKGYSPAIDGEFSPDGSRFVTADRNKTVWLWDPETGDSIATYYHDNTVSFVEFSPDSRYYLSACYDMKIRLWDAETGAFVRIIGEHKYIVVSARFSPDGQYVLGAAFHDDPVPKLWEVSTGNLIREFSGHTGSIYDARFSPDGRVILTRDDVLIKLWADTVTPPAHDDSDGPWSITGPAGVADRFVSDAGMSLFPNPARDRIELLLPDDAGPVRHVTLVDALGREVRRFDDIGQGRTGRGVSIPLTDVPAGVYFVYVLTAHDRYSASVVLTSSQR